MHFQFRLPGFSLGIARLLGWSISLGLAACGGGEGHAGLREPTGTADAGPVGPPGSPGPAGPAGADGANGAKGTNGTGIRTGAGVPASDIGVVGDLYFDSASATLYGPKTDDGWPADGVSLKGAQGDQGDPGAAGNGPTVFISRFFARAGGPGEFYAPISGDGDSALTGNYALATRYEPNATTMPVSCGFTGLYVSGTMVEEPYDPYMIDAFGASIDVTLVKNEVATALHAALDVNLDRPSASVSDLPSTPDVTVMPGDTVALRITPSIPYVSVAMNVSLVCR